MANRKNVKAVPQVESTISVEHTDAPLLKCVARQAFTLGNAHVEAGETFFLVKSNRRPGRYYVVHFNDERRVWQCSCGANCTKHEHTKVSQAYIIDHVVKPQVAAIMSSTTTDDHETDGLGNSKEAWKTRLKAEKQRGKENAERYTTKLHLVKQESEVA